MFLIARHSKFEASPKLEKIGEGVLGEENLSDRGGVCSARLSAEQ